MSTKYSPGNANSPFSVAGITRASSYAINHRAENTRLPAVPGALDESAYAKVGAPISKNPFPMLLVAGGVIVAGYLIVKGL